MIKVRVHLLEAGTEDSSIRGMHKIATGTRPADQIVRKEPQVLPCSQPCCEAHPNGGAFKTSEDKDLTVCMGKKTDK